MPTQDLVTNFSGVGDGQRLTLTASITSGANILTISGATPFVLGDVGKAIFLNASGFQMPTNATVVTITGFNSSSSVTLSANAPSTLSGASTDVLWGTDNTTALMAYRTWAQSQGTSQAQLTIPAGRYCVDLDPFHPLTAGVKNALISGPLNGAASCILSSLIASEFRFGGDAPVVQKGLASVGGISARITTAARGATTVVLVDKTTYGSRVVVGADVFITGFDMQSGLNGNFGYPPNPYFYEHNVISAYDASTGTITLQNALSNTYKSTWPAWDPGDGGHADQGGPATIYVLSDYDRVIELNDLTIDSPYNQCAAHGRDVILRRVVHVGPGLYPTQNKTFAAYATTWPQSLEIDKINGSIILDTCVNNILNFQSASPNTMTVSGGSVKQYTGCPKVISIDSQTFIDVGAGDGSDAKLQVGVTAFGATSRVSITNCTGIKNFISGGAQTDDLPSAASTFYSMSGGILSFPKSANNGTLENPARCFAPGSWITFDKKTPYTQVLDVYEDGTTCFIQTGLAGGFPVSPVSRISVHPCPDFTMRSCTGTAPELEDWNQAPARIPLYSYSKRTYTADGSGTTVKALPFVLGRLISAKLNVTVSGAVTFHESQFDNWSVLKSDYSSYTFAPTIDLSNAGLRTMTGGGAASGAQGADSLADLTSIGQIWFQNRSNSGPIFSANGSNAVVTVEFVMDQGIPAAVPTAVMPLRFRVHA